MAVKTERKIDTTRKINTQKTHQLMFSIFTCLTVEFGQTTENSINLIVNMYPHSKDVLFNKFTRHAEKYEKEVTEFHRDIATTLIAHFSTISSEMLKKIIRKRRKIS